VVQNLLQIVELYSVVELEYVSECFGQGRQAVKMKCHSSSSYALYLWYAQTLAGNPDKVFHGVLDQGRGCLMAFDDSETDVSTLFSRFPTVHTQSFTDNVHDRDQHAEAGGKVVESLHAKNCKDRLVV
jgi:hypothetical protein